MAVYIAKFSINRIHNIQFDIIRGIKIDGVLPVDIEL